MVLNVQRFINLYHKMPKAKSPDKVFNYYEGDMI